MILVAVERSCRCRLRFILLRGFGGVGRGRGSRRGVSLLLKKRRRRRSVVSVGPEMRQRRLLRRVRAVRNRASDGLFEKLRLIRAVRIHDGGRLIVQLLRRRHRVRCRVRSRVIRQRGVRRDGIVRRCVAERTRRRRRLRVRLDGILQRFVRVLQPIRIVAARLIRLRIRIRGVRVRVSRAGRTTAAASTAYRHVVLCVRIVVRFVLSRARRRACCTRL